jgi:hypothetical protein
MEMVDDSSQDTGMDRHGPFSASIVGSNAVLGLTRLADRWRPGMVTALVLVMCAASGCGTAKLAVPAELDATPRLAVSGRLGWMNTQAVRFGGYAADRVDRSWTRGGGVAIGGFARDRRRQSYAFTLESSEGPPLRTECTANLIVKGLNAGSGITLGLDDRSRLECDILVEAGDTAAAWRLELEDDGKTPMRGTLLRGSDRYDVTGTNRVSGGALPASVTTGYHIERNGRAIAAVEVMNDGAVWLNTEDPAERPLLAATAAALLLAEDLRATLVQ